MNNMEKLKSLTKDEMAKIMSDLLCIQVDTVHELHTLQRIV
jgi:hypothetical protein